MCLTNTEYRWIGKQPKPHRQTLMSKAEIPPVLSLQASLPPHPAGEKEEDDRKVSEKTAEVSKAC